MYSWSLKFKMQTTEPQGKKSSITLKSCFMRNFNEKIILGTTISYEQ
jgi:hypothetical protein